MKCVNEYVDKGVSKNMIPSGQTGYPSIDKPWLKFYDEEWYYQTVPQRTVYRTIWDRNKDYLSNKALNFKRHCLTYGQMFEKIEDISKALLMTGIKKGDCVNLCATYTPETVCIVLACSKIGALANFINPLFTTEQKISRFNETDADVLIMVDAMFPYMKDALSELKVNKIVVLPATASMPKMVQFLSRLNANKELQEFVKTDSRCISWNMFLNEGKKYEGNTEAEYEKDRPVIMVYSSGTTGASKGIVLTNDGINATIAHYVNPGFKYSRQDTFLAMIPIWFSTGNVFSMLSPLNLGVCVILEPIFSSENFIIDISKYKPNMFVVATSLLLELVNKCKEKDLSFITYPITGGEKVNIDNERMINDFLMSRGCCAPVLKGYGMCELGGAVTADSFDHIRLGSAGFPLKGITVSSFDIDSNEEMKIGQRGEIRVDSPARMKEYFKNSKATNEYFYVDEKDTVWCCTGDIGYVDDDGYVYILGRKEDSFITDDGIRVYFFDIENAILQNKNIVDCKTVRSDDMKLVAHVSVNESIPTDELIKEIKLSCTDNLPKYAIPTHIKIRESFPVHSNGKRDNESLRKDSTNLIELD